MYFAIPYSDVQLDVFQMSELSAVKQNLRTSANNAEILTWTILSRLALGTILSWTTLSRGGKGTREATGTTQRKHCLLDELKPSKTKKQLAEARLTTAVGGRRLKCAVCDFVIFMPCHRAFETVSVCPEPSRTF